MAHDEKIPTPISPCTVSTGTTLQGPADIESGTARRPNIVRRLLSTIASFCSCEAPEIAVAEDTEATTVRKLEDCPRGFPQAAAFFSSEACFSQYRIFGCLHSRILLDLQSEICALERELDAIDKATYENGNNRLLQSREKDIQSVGRGADGERSRRDVLADVQRKLVQYDDLLLKTRTLEQMQRPSKRDYRSVRTWFNNSNPFVERDATYIRAREDIRSLRSGREWAGFDGHVEDLIRKLDCKLVQYIFRTPDLRAKTSNRDIAYYSSSRIETFAGLIITFIVFILLVLPVVALHRLTAYRELKGTSTFDATGVLIVFTLLFAAAMSLLTKAKRHELFAASAAYCAVLVVFIGNISER